MSPSMRSLTQNMYGSDKLGSRTGDTVRPSIIVWMEFGSRHPSSAYLLLVCSGRSIPNFRSKFILTLGYLLFNHVTKFDLLTISEVGSPVFYNVGFCLPFSLTINNPKNGIARLMRRPYSTQLMF